MPEVAEVKIMADSIQKFLVGNVLLEIQAKNDSFWQKRTKGLASLKLPQRVIHVGTKGKFCYIQLEDRTALGIGFGMTGNIRVEPTPEYLAVYNYNRGSSQAVTASEYLKHVMLCIKYLAGEAKEHFYYHDMRRFGFWHFLTEKELEKKLTEFGPDILQEQNVEKPLIIKLFRKRNNLNICEVLLNHQEVLSGIGNYIKAEILYRTGVYPLCRVADLADDTLYQLYTEACQVASRAYRSGGASLYTYTGIEGDRSSFKEELLVYNRQFDNLGRKVERMETPDKRTTHWVPSHQVVGKVEEMQRKESKQTLQIPAKRKIIVSFKNLG